MTTIGNLSYQYDAAGNQTKAYNGSQVTRQVDYNHAHKPTLIDNKTGTTTRFEYGPSNSRFKRVDIDNNQTTTSYYKIIKGDYC